MEQEAASVAVWPGPLKLWICTEELRGWVELEGMEEDVVAGLTWDRAEPQAVVDGMIPEILLICIMRPLWFHSEIASHRLSAGVAHSFSSRVLEKVSKSYV